MINIGLRASYTAIAPKAQSKAGIIFVLLVVLRTAVFATAAKRLCVINGYDAVIIRTNDADVYNSKSARKFTKSTL